MKNIHILPSRIPSGIHFYDYHITSDEEIKEGDWGLSKLNEVILFGRSYNEKFYKKIILTTDQDLIKDGVQAIDDEFLEWFVKNPSCEEVDIDAHVQSTENGHILYYQILITKEEPKKETLEEAAARLVKETTLYGNQEATIGSSARSYFETELRCVLMGMEWQKQQGYSEEEVLKIINDIVEKHCTYFLQDIKDGVKLEWFKQLKKQVR